MKALLMAVLLAVLLTLGPPIFAAGTLPSVLTWTNTDIVNQIQIEKSASATGTFTILQQVPTVTVTYTDATNGPGETACYRVAYFNPSGIGPYAGPVCKTFQALPTQTPGALTVK